MSRVEVSTTQFQFAHGRTPRGSGDWYFTAVGGSEHRGGRWFHGMYSDARAQAVAWARETGAYRVEVGS